MDVRNVVLGALPEERAIALQPVLVTLPGRYVMAGPAAPLDMVLLPETCVIAHLNEMSDGRSVATTFIGYHGLAAPGILGSHFDTDATLICCVPGTAWRVAPERWANLIRTWDGGPEVIAAAGRWCSRQALQLSACGRVHPLHRRTATLLLLLYDKAGRRDLPLTHEFLGSLLGVHRPSISLVIERFADLHVIDVARGGITLVDKRALETWACECFEAIVAPTRALPPLPALHATPISRLHPSAPA